MARVAIEIRDSTNSVVGTLDVGSDLSFPLSITKSIASLNNMGKRGGSFTKTFKIPATKENNKLLVNLYSASQRNVKKMKDKKDALILVDGMIRARGYIKILSALIGKRPEKYTLKFFGDNLDWVTQVAELNLDDIIFNNDSQAYTKANIEASWTGTYDGGNDHVYPWISYGQYINGIGVLVEDMRITIRCRAIIERTLNQIGYNLSSTFMGTDKFKQLVYLPGNKFQHLTSVFATPKKYAVGINNEQIINPGNISEPGAWQDIQFKKESGTGFFDTSDNFDASNIQYVVPETSQQKFKVQLRVRQASEVEYRIQLYNPTGTVILSEATGTTAFGATEEQIIFETGYFILQAGVNVRVRIRIDNTVFSTQKIKIQANADLDAENGTYYRNEVSSRIVDTNTYSISDILPDTSVMDFFNDLTKLFNLYWVSDLKTKTIRVEPRDTFYKDISDSLNWSDKLDISKTPILSFITDSYKRDFLFRYVEDSVDGYVKTRNENQGNILGSYLHIFPDRFRKGKQDFKPSQLSPSYWGKDDTSLLIGNNVNAPVTTRIWSKFLSNGSPPPALDKFNPRILNFRYANQKRENGQSVFWKWEGAISASTDLIPAALMHSIYDTRVDTEYNLSFSGSDGLFATYYSRSIKLIEDGIQLEAMFYLKASDFATDMRTPIYLSSPDELQGYWIIDRIHDWSPVRDRSTKVTLIKLINYEPVPIDATQIPIEFTESVKTKLADVMTGGGTEEDDDIDDFNSPSSRLSNGTGNMALKGGGAVAFGQGCVAFKKNQNILGAYPVIDDSKFALGIGTGKDDRITGFRSDADGNVTMYGGGVYMINENGERVQVTMESGNKIRNVYLK